MNFVILLTIFGICTGAPQFLHQQYNPSPYAHEAVLVNSAMEDALPRDLKNHFYDNPKIAAALAQESWLAKKEMQVINREADRIPRQKIFDVLQQAGFAR
ncbi:uncharacterized protein [Fopius arisanus]|uniref:Syd_0 protein n=1 Tax=Fopius arisanus TaxID=64838 RepID=A0A0C9RF15_9HYME|nr:PREDICTED: uncharacterized protein LOC105264580 [Fopius arisanus]